MASIFLLASLIAKTIISSKASKSSLSKSSSKLISTLTASFVPFKVTLTNELYWFQDGFQCDIFDYVCKDEDKDCTQCIIDWARKEVEK